MLNSFFTITLYLLTTDFMQRMQLFKISSLYRSGNTSITLLEAQVYQQAPFKWFTGMIPAFIFCTVVYNALSLFFVEVSFSAVFHLSFEFLLLNCVLVLQTVLWSCAILWVFIQFPSAYSVNMFLNSNLLQACLLLILVSCQPVPAPEPITIPPFNPHEVVHNGVFVSWAQKSSLQVSSCSPALNECRDTDDLT